MINNKPETKKTYIFMKLSTLAPHGPQFGCYAPKPNPTPMGILGSFAPPEVRGQVQGLGPLGPLIQLRVEGLRAEGEVCGPSISFQVRQNVPCVQVRVEITACRHPKLRKIGKSSFLLTIRILRIGRWSINTTRD